MRVLHLSDTHLTDVGVSSGGGTSLHALLDQLRHVGALDLVVVSGDCSDDGSPSSYRALRDLIEPYAAARGARVVYARGNHDQGSGYAAELGNGCGGEPLPGTDDRTYGTCDVDGLRVVALDSHQVSQSAGYLDARQLDWLRGTLATPAARGSVVVVHHPPVPSVTPIHAGIELQNPSDLIDTLAGTDVRLILSGHYHHSLVDAVKAGEHTIPVIVAPGIVNLNDVVAPPGHERATCGRGACLIDLTDRGPRIETVITSSEDVAFDMDPAAVAELGARIWAPQTPKSAPTTGR